MFQEVATLDTHLLLQHIALLTFRLLREARCGSVTSRLFASTSRCRLCSSETALGRVVSLLLEASRSFAAEPTAAMLPGSSYLQVA